MDRRRRKDRIPGDCEFPDNSSGNKETPHGAKRRGRDGYAAIAVCGLLLLMVAIVFCQTLGFDFVNYDDGIYVFGNSHLKQGLTRDGLAWAFTTTDCTNWHPLTWLSYLVDYQLYGLNPRGYHLTNVLLHAAAAIALFLVLWQMTGELWLSGFVAAIFAVHPLRAESVAWVAERKDVLSGLFFMLTLASYVGYVRHSFSLLRYLLVITIFALGLMAKPMLVTLPLVLLLLDYWPLKRTRFLAADDLPVGPARVSSTKLLLEKLPLLAFSAASCVITPLAQGRAVARLDAIPFSARIGNALIAYVTYLRQFFFPTGLAAFYLYEGDNLVAWRCACAAIFLAVICIAVVAGRRNYPYLFVGWYWYLGMLVPAIGLVQVGAQSMADRYTYLPQIGLAIGVAWGTKHVAQAWLGRGWTWGVGSASLILVILMGWTWQQTSYWQNGVTLWDRVLHCTEANAISECNFGCALMKRGGTNEAIDHLRAALKFNPHLAEAHAALGYALGRSAQVDEAIEHYRDAVAFAPDSADTENDWGMLLLQKNRVDEAVGHFQAAIRLKPDDLRALVNLGIAYFRQGHIREAVAQYSKALDLDPGFAIAYSNRGVALFAEERTDQGMAECRKAVDLSPDDADCHYNLGVVLHRQHRADEAMAEFKTALRLKPDFTDAHSRLAMLLAAGGQIDDAIAHYQNALQTQPDYVEVHNNLGSLLAKRGQVDEAIIHFRRAVAINPRYANAYFNLGNSLAGQGMLAEALSEYRKGLEISPDAAAHNSFGQLLFRAGRVDDAIAHFEAALKILPGYGEARENLASALNAREDAKKKATP